MEPDVEQSEQKQLLWMSDSGIRSESERCKLVSTKSPCWMNDHHILV